MRNVWLIVCFLTAVCGNGALAQTDYPSRPVKMIVTFPAGGASDIVARIFAERLSAVWKQQVYIENRIGGGGSIGTEAAYRAARRLHVTARFQHTDHQPGPDPQAAVHLCAWISQGHLTREQYANRIDALACSVVAGQAPGRVSKDERIVAIVQGMAIGDIAFAAHALNEAERLGRGTVVNLP